MLKTPFRLRPLIEELEPRILFSADLAPVVLDGFQPAPEQRVLTAGGEFSNVASATRHELVIVDTGVADYETLLADIRNQTGSDRHLDVVLLDASRDGIQQITEALKQYGNLDALHIISHGESGELQLGSSLIDSNSLMAQAATFQVWGNALTADADILLYGCDVAEGSAGASFVAALSNLTSADVAASTDLTGNPMLGGDWTLETQTGTVEASMLLGPVQTTWQGTLNMTVAPTQQLANTTISNDQASTPSSRQVAINPTDGSFVAVWTSKNQDGSYNGVYLRRFDAAGNPLTGEIQANSYINNNQQNPAIAMDASGNFVVVWESDGQDGSGYGIYAQRFNADASTNGSEMLVTTTTANNQTLPSVAMDASGDFVVAWTSENEDGDGKGVFARRYDHTTGWSAAFQVNTTTSSDQYDPSVAMNASGAFVIVWTSSGQDYGITTGVYGRLFDAAGSTIKNEFRINATTSGNQYSADVAMNSSGSFVVAFADDSASALISALGSGIYANVYDNTGTASRSNILVDQNLLGDQLNPAVSLQDSGEFIIVWESQNQVGDGTGYGIVARHFKADSSAYQNEQVINIDRTSDQLAPSLAWNGSQAVFIWSGKSADDSHGVSFRMATIASISVNSPPAITLDGGGATASVTVAENSTAAVAVTATDPDVPVQTLAFNLAGGTDQAKFNIDSATGVLTFLAAPDFENPADAGGNNVYEVIVQVSDGTLTGTQAIAVTVSNANEAPTAIGLSSSTATENTDSSAGLNIGTLTTTDVDSGDTATYSIIGGADAAVFSVGASNALILTDGVLDFEAQASYAVTVRVTDAGGLIHDQNFTITVNDLNEAPAFISPAATTATENATYSYSIAVTDPDTGASLAITALTLPAWLTLTDNGNGTATLSGTPTNAQVGSHSVVLQVSDGSFVATQSFSLTVSNTNDAPTASNTSFSTLEDTPYSGILPSATDIDGDPITYSLDTAASHGVAVVNADGSYTYTPTANYAGSDSFTFTVSDGLGGSNIYSVSVSVTPVNDAPSGISSAVSVNEDAVYTFQTSDFGFSDPGDSPANGLLTIKIVSLPSAGTLLYAGNPVTAGQLVNAADISLNELRFVPAANANGAGYASFSFQIQDDGGTSNGGINLDPTLRTLTINITPVNDAPVANSDSYPGNEDNAVTGNVLGNDVDVEGALLTATLLSGPANGSLTLNTDGSFSYTPNANFNGTDSFTYQASDGVLNSSPVTVALTINPVNDAPTASNATISATEDTAYSGTLPTASDTEGDTVTFSPNGVASNGTASINADGSFTYTPNANFNGTDSFSYRISDGQGGVNSYTVTLSVAAVNDAPSLSSSLLNVGQGLTVTVGSAHLLAADVDNTAVELSFVLTGVPTAGTLALNGTPLGLNDTFTQADLNGGLVTYTQTSAASSTDSLSIKVVDPASAQATGILVIAITAPAAPPMEAAAPMAPSEPAPPPAPAAPSPVIEKAVVDQAAGKAAAPIGSLPENNPEQANRAATLIESVSPYSAAPANATALTSAYAAFSTSLLTAANLPQTTLLDALNTAMNTFAHDAQALQTLQASLGNTGFQQQLNQLQDTIRQQLNLDKNTVASTLAVSTGLSVGYVLWLVRGGVLLSSLLSTLPAWRLIDPLPILGHLKQRKDDDEDDDSLEAMLKKTAEKSKLDTQVTDANV